MQYLSNVDRDGLDEFRTYVAALRSGQNVKYLDCPMPASDYERDTYYKRNYDAGNFNHMGCIAGFEKDGDYSEFWVEWQKLA